MRKIPFHPRKLALNVFGRDQLPAVLTRGANDGQSVTEHYPSAFLRSPSDHTLAFVKRVFISRSRKPSVYKRLG